MSGGTSRVDTTHVELLSVKDVNYKTIDDEVNEDY